MTTHQHHKSFPENWEKEVLCEYHRRTAEREEQRKLTDEMRNYFLLCREHFVTAPIFYHELNTAMPNTKVCFIWYKACEAIPTKNLNDQYLNSWSNSLSLLNLLKLSKETKKYLVELLIISLYQSLYSIDHHDPDFEKDYTIACLCHFFGQAENKNQEFASYLFQINSKKQTLIKQTEKKLTSFKKLIEQRYNHSSLFGLSREKYLAFSSLLHTYQNAIQDPSRLTTLTTDDEWSKHLNTPIFQEGLFLRRQDRETLATKRYHRKDREILTPKWILAQSQFFGRPLSKDLLEDLRIILKETETHAKILKDNLTALARLFFLLCEQSNYSYRLPSAPTYPPTQIAVPIAQSVENFSELSIESPPNIEPPKPTKVRFCIPG